MARTGNRASVQVVKTFASAGEFARTLDDLVTRGKIDPARQSNAEWAGDTYDSARAHLMTGQPDAVERARAIMERIVAEVAPTARPAWDRAPAGYFPCVPAYLAGDPACMFRRVEEPSTAAPVRVFASLGANTHTTARDMEARGCCILAFAMLLSERRPVELYAINELGNYNPATAIITMIRIDTSPLDMATASYVLTAPAMSRQLMFGYGDHLGFERFFSWRGNPLEAWWQQKVKDFIGCTDDDLYIPASMNTDPLMVNPVTWINAQLERYANV